MSDEYEKDHIFGAMRSYRVTLTDIVRAILSTETGLKPVRCVLFTLPF